MFDLSNLKTWTDGFWAVINAPHILEPIQEDWIHEQRLGLVKRFSMIRIMARRTKAATVLA
jgi:hypothetical protein